MEPTAAELLAEIRKLGASIEKASGTTNRVIPPHGPNALFNTPGLEPNVISAIVQPLPGLMGYLESRGHVNRSNFLSPLFAVLTGQTASTGTEPTLACSEDVRVAGDLKLCRQQWPFGEFTMKTKPVRVDRIGQLVNRSEPLDLRLINNPFAELPETGVALNPAQLFRSDLAKSIVELSNAIRRDYCHVMYDGNPANTAASEGGYLEPAGLDLIVNDNYRDSVGPGGGPACPAANSLVTSLNSAIVQNSGPDVVMHMVEVYRAQKYLAQQTRMGDIEFVWVMRYQAWLAISQVWPCTYLTYRCNNLGTGTDVVVNASEQAQELIKIRKGMYLPIDGDDVKVLIDDCAPELNVGGGNFESDIYLLPIRSSVAGPLTYMEYYNYHGFDGVGDRALAELGPRDEYRITPDGRFIVFFMNGTAFCKQIMVRTTWRLIVRAPFLAARVTDVRYNVLFHERSPFPGTSFHFNGGSTSFTAQVYDLPVG